MPIWGQTRCLGMKTKRQQAVALQTLRACQRPLHPRQGVRNHWDQRALPCDGVAAGISQTGVTDSVHQRVQQPGHCPYDNFGSSRAGLRNRRAGYPPVSDVAKESDSSSQSSVRRTFLRILKAIRCAVL